MTLHSTKLTTGGWGKWSDVEHFNQKSKNDVRGGYIADWHDSAFNQVDHTDTLQSEYDADVKMDARGRLIPKQTTHYKVGPTLDCCQKTCQTSSLPLRDQED